MGNQKSIIGPLPRSWLVQTVGELCAAGGGSVQTGPFGSQLHASDYQDVGTPVVMPANLGQNRIVPDDIARIGLDDVERLSRHRLEVGDIVFPRRGDLSRYAHIDHRYAGWLCGTGCLRIRLGDSAVRPTYLADYLGHPAVQDWITSNAVGTTMLNLNTSIVERLPVAIPPLPEQRAIAHILGTLDDKIELNRQMNQTLEAIAHAIFKSWFVDFDPVHAKLQGREPVGMDAATAALFPDHFEESELGPIPAGWKVVSLSKVAHYQNGIAWKKYAAQDGEPFLPVIKIRELRQESLDDSSDRTGIDIKPSCKVYDGDVLFSWSGSLMVDVWTGGNGALNQHLFKVTSKRFPKWFYYYWTKHHLEQFQRIAEAKATTMGHIRRRDLAAAMTVVPPGLLLQKMTNVMAPFLERIIHNRLESRTLAELRDTLLPKLISGELRVPEAPMV